jgi:penicillin-binding protein 2
MFAAVHGHENVMHHRVPWDAQHRGTHGNPDGFLTFADALQRSCNVYFETLADQLGLDRLSRYYKAFGLGRDTGIGIPEVSGLVPSSYRGPRAHARSVLWFSAIGQTQVLASPLQMANVAATIARDGVWVRPRLVADGVETRPILVRDPADPSGKTMIPAPDRVDLGLPKAALAAAREGMVRVVNAPGGTGRYIHRKDMYVAGKTGTAEAARMRLPKLDRDLKLVKDENGRTVYEELPLARVGGEQTRSPWYRGYGKEGKDLKHAWFIGFAPAENPQVAFAVMLQYGGSGGANAGPIAAKVLDACVRHGYLKPAGPVPGVARVAGQGEPELVRAIQPN